MYPTPGTYAKLGDDGQIVVDSASVREDGKTIRRDAVYSTRTVHITPDAAISIPLVLPSRATKVGAAEVVNGKARRLPLSGTRDGGVIQLWVGEDDKLPVRAASLSPTGLIVVDYEWLPRTPITLARLDLPIPGDLRNRRSR